MKNKERKSVVGVIQLSLFDTFYNEVEDKQVPLSIFVPSTNSAQCNNQAKDSQIGGTDSVLKISYVRSLCSVSHGESVPVSNESVVVKFLLKNTPSF